MQLIEPDNEIETLFRHNSPQRRAGIRQCGVADDWQTSMVSHGRRRNDLGMAGGVWAGSMPYGAVDGSRAD